MTGRRAVAALAIKELRELGPLWLCILGGMLAMNVIAPLPVGNPISGALYVLGTVALGAMSIGHEFRQGTLTSLLVQPIGRGQVLATKAGVLVLLVGILTAIIGLQWLETLRDRSALQMFGVMTPLACALFLAPWLTILFRSELAGMVLAIAIPLLLVTIVRVMAVADTGADVLTTHGAAIASGMAVIYIGGAIGAIRSFLRLQVAAPAALTVPLPLWLPPAPRSRRAVRRQAVSPWLSLIRKELMLQRLPVVVAALFVVAWMTIVVFADAALETFHWESLRASAFLYSALVVLLIGACASAEERRLGTWPLQSIVPVAWWKQWAIKMFVVAGTAGLLAVLVPALLEAVGPSVQAIDRVRWWTALSVLPLALYISSLNRNTIAVILIAICVSIAGGLLMVTLSGALQPALAKSWTTLGTATEALARVRSVEWLRTGLTVGLSVMVLRFAMVNHRSIRFNGSRIRRQLIFIAALVLAIVVCDAATYAWRHSGWYSLRSGHQPALHQTPSSR